jgi:hypothetical protein
MTFNESQRIQLHQALGRQIGEEMAGVLMSSLPPFDWSQVATKDDLKAFATRDEMNVKFAELRTEMAALRGDLTSEVSDLRVELYKSLRSNTLTMVGLNFAIGSLLLGVAQFIGR